MLKTMFAPDPIQFITRTSNDLFTVVDERRKKAEEASHDRWYCVREILYEQYLWDMRCWKKPKYQYSRQEIAEHIQTWLTDHTSENWSYNCGHCLYCIRKLLRNGWATMDDIAGFVIRNNNLTYMNEIGTWNKGGLGQEEDGIV